MILFDLTTHSRKNGFNSIREDEEWVRETKILFRQINENF